MIEKLLSETMKNKRQTAEFSEVEHKAFSKWGDDGIIQWLVNNLEFPIKLS
jgi:1,2-phenylacetyl-CoA epoxidase catalytic subunit